MKKRKLASLMTHQYKKLPVTIQMWMLVWMQFNVMPRTNRRPVIRIVAAAAAGLQTLLQQCLSAYKWAFSLI